MEDKITIVFTADVFPDIRKMLGWKNLKCSYCNKKITKKNIGGILSYKKIVCNNFCCLYDAIKKGDIKK